MIYMKYMFMLNNIQKGPQISETYLTYLLAAQILVFVLQTS